MAATPDSIAVDTGCCLTNHEKASGTSVNTSKLSCLPGSIDTAVILRAVLNRPAGHTSRTALIQEPGLNDQVSLVHGHGRTAARKKGIIISGPDSNRTTKIA
jgi:hypothetical protein